MIRRFLSVLLVVCGLTVWVGALAQAPFQSFPPGAFQSRGPLDPAPASSGITVDTPQQNAVSATNTITRTISTAGTNRILVVPVYANNPTGGTAPTFLSIADTSLLTWNLALAQVTMNNAGQGPADHRIALYWALAASQLTGDTITVVTGATVDHLNITVIPVVGLNTTTPVDPNANSCKSATATGFGTNPMDATGLSTTNANSILIATTGTSYVASGDNNWTPYLESGYTFDVTAYSGAGTNWGGLGLSHKIVTATQSSVQGGFTASPNGFNGWLTILCAFQAS